MPLRRTNAGKHTCLELGFEPTMPVTEPAIAFCVSDRAATVICFIRVPHFQVLDFFNRSKGYRHVFSLTGDTLRQV
jgi:hypothetical protein